MPMVEPGMSYDEILDIRLQNAHAVLDLLPLSALLLGVWRARKGSNSRRCVCHRREYIFKSKPLMD